MRMLTLTAALATGNLTTLTDADACKGYRDTETVSVEFLDMQAFTRLLEKDGKVALFDANGLATRSKYGAIPGASLLSHYKSYSLKELPPAKAAKLVFYCGGARCKAAEKSALRAVEEGYTDVAVFRGGIQEWAATGRKTVPVPAS